MPGKARVVGPSTGDVFGCHVLSHSLLHSGAVSLNHDSHSVTSTVCDLITLNSAQGLEKSDCVGGEAQRLWLVRRCLLWG